MSNISFTDLVQQKVVERREGRSAAVQAAMEADAAFRARAAPLLAEASELIEVLSSDPMFANAMGHPKVTIRREDTDGRQGTLGFAGPAGTLTFSIYNDKTVWVRINPALTVVAALDCGLSYGIDPLKGEMSHVDDLIVRVRDYIAEFVADVHLSSAANILLLRPKSVGE